MLLNPFPKGHLKQIENFIADQKSVAVRAKWKHKAAIPKVRWRSPNCPDAGCLVATKSEARAYFKSLLGELPVGFVTERY